MKVNRRTTFRILAGAGAGTGFAAAQAPPSPARAGDADANLESAREDLRGSASRIAAVDLPRATEPAFFFRAY
jgi:hypothetical protein